MRDDFGLGINLTGHSLGKMGHFPGFYFSMPDFENRF